MKSAIREYWILVLLALVSLVLSERTCYQMQYNVRDRGPDSCPVENYKYKLSPSQLMFEEHPVSVSASIGSTISFTCSLNTQPVTNSEGQVLIWRHNGSALNYSDSGALMYPEHWYVNSTGLRSMLTLYNFSEGDRGYYECVIGDGTGWYRDKASDVHFATLTVSKRAWINRTVGNGEAPVLGLPHIDVYVLEGLENRFQYAECEAPGAGYTVYWYKDGRDISHHYNSGTGELVVYNADFNLHGVYQCFVENDSGSDYVNIRVLPRGYANPPSSFSCRAVDSEDDHSLPTLKVSWGPPDLLAGDVSEYDYFIKLRGECFNVGNATCAEIELDEDTVLTCSAFFSNSNLHPQEVAGVEASVENFRTCQRRLNQENVQELTVICNSDEISATLPNPELPPCICLSKLRLWAVCLQEGSSEPMTMLKSFDYPPCEAEPFFPLQLPVQPHGSVCVFGGEYEVDLEDQTLIIPPMSCFLPSQEDGPLPLDCPGVITVSLNGSINTNPTGLCVTPQPKNRPSEVYYCDIHTLREVPLNSVNVFSNFSGASAQCIIREALPTNNTVESCTNNTVESCTNNTTSEDHIPAVVWVVISLFVSSLFLVVMVIVGMYFLSSYWRYRERKEKEHLHYLASIVERQLSHSNSETLPVDPCARVLSSPLLNSEVNSLYQDGTVLTQEPVATPTSLLEEFVSSDGIPIKNLVESTGQDQDSSASSSGYGMAHTFDNQAYFQQRLQDFTEMSKEENHYVREYFEHDIDGGYVHMVP